MISNDPKFNLGQLNAYKLMFAIKLLMKKQIIFFWSAGFSDLPAINATVFNRQINLPFSDENSGQNVHKKWTKTGQKLDKK